MKIKKLIKSCQKGDKSSFEELIRLYYPYVSRFLIKTVCDENLSEDLTQETFIKVIRNIEKFDINSKNSFGTWIIAIAKNCYIDYLRKNKIKFENIDDFYLSDNDNIELNVLRKLKYEEALFAINTLPKEQGIAIRLKYIENLTLEEIAHKFNVPSKTIKSRIHEGTVKLRKILNRKEGIDNNG